MLGFTEILQNAIYFFSLYYTVFWLLVFFDTPRESGKKESKAHDVSIVIPAYNEGDNMEATLDAVAGLDYPKGKISVIVVDDGSKDDTLKVARDWRERLAKEYGFREFTVITQRNQGKFAAMNNALRKVSTPFFATLDADSFPKKDSLKRIMAEFKEDEIAAVSPVLKVYRPKNRLQMMQWFEYSVNHFYKSIITRANSIHVTPGPLSVYRTKVVKELGGFRKGHKTEDMELAMRIQLHHHKIVQCDKAFVFTKAPYSIKSLYHQRIRWNYGTFKNLVDYRKMIFNRKYGDFGMFQLPTIFISGMLGITLLGLIAYDFFKGIKPFFQMLQLYDYNIYLMIAQTKFGNIIWLDLDAKALVTFGGFFLISIFVIWMSLRMHEEKYSLGSSLAFVMYIFLYYIFLAFVWLNVFKDVLLKKERAWRR